MGEKKSKSVWNHVTDWLRDKDSSRKKIMKKQVGRRQAARSAGEMLKKLFK